jgi:hypothetical protein
MTVDTERPVFGATDTRPTVGDAAATQELLRTMAAVVRTLFGVALQAPAGASAEEAEPAQLAPVSISLPPETPTLVSVPVTYPEPVAPIAVDFPPPVDVQQPVEVQQPEQAEQPLGLSVVPASEPAASLPMPSISLADSSWAPAPPPPEAAPTAALPAYSPAEPAESLPMIDGYPTAIAVPAYAAPVLPEPATTDRHSLALLHEIAFLDD